MPSSSPLARPLDTLHSLTKGLEAATLECLAKPRKKAVHNLRTLTRRIEAQLQLLSTVPEVRLKSKPRNQALDLLKELRHAAGLVRDLDVQRGLLADIATQKRPRPALRKGAHHLRRTLKQERQKRAEALLELLHKRQGKIPEILNGLLSSLESAEPMMLTEPHLIELIHDWYAQHCVQQHAVSHPEDPAFLHNIRKKAKLARYLAESAPKSATKAQRLAARYEDLQQAGGEWHDWLLLNQIAIDELGKSSELAAYSDERADRCLQSYKRKLKHKI